MIRHADRLYLPLLFRLLTGSVRVSHLRHRNQAYRVVYLHTALLFLLLPHKPFGQTTPSAILFTEEINKIQEILILPARFDSYYLTSGGIREYNDEMSIRSRKCIIANICSTLTVNHFLIKPIESGSPAEKRWSALRQFYSVVNREIVKNTYSPLRFPNAKSTFNYSLPPLPDSLVYPTTDAVLFIDGFDDCSTQPRKSKATTAAVVTAVSLATVLLGAPGVIVSVPKDQTVATCALVNRYGKVIWYYRHHKSGDIDMTQMYNSRKFVSGLLRTLKRSSDDL